MINNSSNSNSKKNEIVFTSAISEQIPMIISDTKPIIANDDIAITTLCCLNLVNKFCIVLFIIENIFIQITQCKNNICLSSSQGNKI